MKTPSQTRKLKAEMKACTDVGKFLELSLDFIKAPKESHRTPKTFDKHTGEPKTWVWKIQPSVESPIHIVCTSDKSQTSDVSVSPVVASKLLEYVRAEPSSVYTVKGEMLLIRRYNKINSIFVRDPLIGVIIEKVNSYFVSD